MSDLTPNDSKYESAIRIWATYQLDTEIFDRTLPGWWHPRATEEWIVRNDAACSSHKYARQCHNVAVDAIHSNCISLETSERARRYVLTLRFREWQQLVAASRPT